MEAKLIIVGGKANKGHVSLKLPTTVGRSREADLTIAHPMVSRRHCELFEENGLLMVRDLGSLNGTIVRKERITKAVPIHPKEEFTVGPLTFRAEYKYAGEVAAPSPVAPSATGEAEPPPDFFAEEQPSADEAAAPSLEPAASGGDADGDLDLPEFDAWDAGSEGKTPETPAGAAAKKAAAEPTSPPQLPGDEKPSKAEAEIPESPAADGEGGVSDFALGPVTPQSEELDKLMASSDNDDAPPSFDEPPSLEPEKAAGQGASKEKAADSATPPSSNGQKPAAPKEFSEEDLDEFFKDAL